MTKKKSNKPEYYQDYLELEKILNSQNLNSDKNNQHAHDEMLFIIIHQVYELWFKQIIYELDSVINIFLKDDINESNISTAVSRLTRITEIQKILIDQVGVLETMTPMDFLDFRDLLVPASGFQSKQFRLIENKLGLDQKKRFTYGNTNYKTYLNQNDSKDVQDSENQSNLFILMEKWLERTPFLNWGNTSFWKEYESAVSNMLNNDLSIIKENKNFSNEEKKIHIKHHKNIEKSFGVVIDINNHNEMVNSGEWRLSHQATQAALLILLYRDQPILNNPYHFLTKLVDIDELFTTWRYRHVLMVSRMIGRKIGTGGSTGSKYLNKTTEKHRVFQDINQLTTFLIPRSSLPELPEKVKNDFGFYYHIRKK
jgi:tryptophan 2,3-dioxygenase